MRLTLLTRVWFWTFLLVLASWNSLGQDVAEMDYSLVKGKMDGLSVREDFKYGSLQVIPETAYSATKEFEQTVNFYHNASVAQYVWVDFYIPENLTKLEVVIDNRINFSFKNITNQTWGNVSHYHNTKGFLLFPNKNVSVKVKYSTLSDKGKWNARIWGGGYDDWHCVWDVNKNCTFDYTIDPQYTAFQGSDLSVEGSGRIRLGDNITNGTQNRSQFIYQSFILNSSLTGNASIEAINLSLDRLGTAGTCQVNITGATNFTLGLTGRDGHGLIPNGSTYGNTSFPTSALSTAKNIFNFSFTTPAQIVVNETYIFMVSCVNPGGTSPNVGLYGTTELNNYNCTGANCRIFSRQEGGYYENGSIQDAYFNIVYNLTEPGNFTLTVQNITWITPANETVGHNFTVNVSIGENVRNISAALNYNGSVFAANISQNGTLGSNHSWFVFNASHIRAPIVSLNGTFMPFNWSFNTTLSNGTIVTTNVSQTNNQTVLWSFYPESINRSENVTEEFNVTVLVNTTQFGNLSSVNMSLVLQYNNTNLTGTFIAPNGSRRTDMYNTTAPEIESEGINNTNITLTPWVNITFNGVNILRTFNKTNQTITNSGLNNSVNVTNVTWITPINETLGQNFTINISSGDNIATQNASLVYNNTRYTSSLIETGNIGVNHTWRVYNVSGVRAPIVNSNGTILTFNWSIDNTRANGSDFTSTSNTENQSVTWAFYPEGINGSSMIVDGAGQSILVNTTNFGNSTGVTFEFRLQYNNTNITNTTLLPNTSRTVNMYNFTTPFLSGGQTNVTIGITPWINLTFDGRTLLRTFNTTNQTINRENRNETVTIQNVTWVSPANETVGYNFTINISFGINVTNISDGNFTLRYNNTNYVTSLLLNGSLGINHTWKVYNASLVRTPLVNTNSTVRTFNWTFDIQYSYGTNTTNTSLTNNQTILWSFYPQTIIHDNNVTETESVNWTVNHTNFGNSTGVAFIFRTLWNNTNITGTFVSNSSNETQINYSLVIPKITENVFTNQSFNLTPSVNLTFNGMNVERNTTLRVQQTVGKIILTNCTDGNTTNTTTTGIQYYFRDADTISLINADITGTFIAYANTSNVNRTFTFTFLSNSSPRICRFPTTRNLYVDRDTTITATGYTTQTESVLNLSLNLNSTITLFLSNTTSGSTVTVTVVDQNDAVLQGYTVEVYRVSGIGNVTFLADGVTNSIGQVQFTLTLPAVSYQFRVKSPAGVTLISVPSSGGMVLTSTSLTIKIFLVQPVTLATLINMRLLQYNLTFTNSTKMIRLDWYDTNNITSNNCLEVVNMSSGNSTLLNRQCSSNLSGTFTFNVTTIKDLMIAKYIATNKNDSLNYLIDAIDVDTRDRTNLGSEGLFLAFLLIGAMSAMGAYVNPSLGLIFMAVGVVGTVWIGILPLGWMALSGIVILSLLGAFALTRD